MYELNPQSLTRRDAMRAGVSSCLGLNLAGLLRAQIAQAEATRSREILPSFKTPKPAVRSCILLFYYGGPSHLDTFDMKPEAPAEIRGEFKSIATSVPGLRICEHLPHMARLMHKVALVRSVHHRNRLHDSASTEVLTGRPSPQGDREEFAPIKQFFPCYGATLSHLRRHGNSDVPHASLPFVFHNVVDVPCQGGGFLGSAFDPLQISVDVNSQSYHAGALTARDGVPLARITGRRRLLDRLEQARTDRAATALPDTAGAMIDLTHNTAQLTRYYDRAFELLGSESLHRALDLSQESPATRERYGFGPAPVPVGEGGGGGNGAEMGIARQMRGQNLLVARRLVEAGIPFVNVYDFRQQGQNWDAHFKVFNQHRNHLLPLADQSLAALIGDLDARGLLDSTLVVAMGEFGRTPRINKDGGRDHWPDCYTILLAGGGIQGGAIYGASDRFGAYPASDPVSPADLAATIFSRFGIDPSMEIHDSTGRPYKVADGNPLTGLFG